MYPQILAFVVKGDPNGGTVDIGSWPFIVGSLPFVIVIVLIVMLTWYFFNKKRFEHQQILVAIEKGIPISELRPIPKKDCTWIESLAIGIFFLIVGPSLSIIVLLIKGFVLDKGAAVALIFSMAMIAIGIASVIASILRRKAEKALSSDKSALDANHGQ